MEIIFLSASKERPYSPFKIPEAAILNGAQCTTGPLMTYRGCFVQSKYRNL